MAAFRNLSIRHKLTLANVATMALALLLASVTFVVYEAVTFRDRIVRQMATQAEIIGYNSATALLFADRDSAMKTLAALRAERHVVAAGIYTPAGVPFATYQRKGARLNNDLDIDAKGDGHRFHAGRLLVFRNILVEGENVGGVRLLSDMDELTASVRRYILISLFVFIAAFAAALPVLARLQRLILGPIMNLVQKARTVSERRDYSIRAEAGQGDELGLLVENFNEMLSQIQKRDQELKRARDSAQAANRAKDEFLAVVSHELRTPLTPVLAWIYMLRSPDLDGERRAHGLDVIERNIKSQAQLIEDLLDISRIISGKLRLDVRPMELAPVVQAAIESVRSMADARAIRLQTIVDPRVVMMTGDPERLQQVFWNLLSNAIKFTPKGGEVRVVVQRVNSHAEVTVSDTGKGIDPEFLPFVFERFRQADSSTTRKHGGLGIGLSIVRNLVELHGGRVRAESAGDGRGASFTVELPISVLHPQAREERTKSSAEAAGPEPENTAGLQGLRVLAVDDDPDTLEMVSLLLARNGAEVRTASAASTALKIFESWLPDLLISDIGMPDEDGFELIRKVRALAPERGGRVPALALTAYARIADRLKVLAAGFQMHVPKPIEPAELVAVVNSLAEWTSKEVRH